MASIGKISTAIGNIRTKASRSSKGASAAAIEAELGVGSGNGVTAAQVSIALKRNVVNGKLVQVKDSYKVAAAKAPAPRKPAAKTQPAKVHPTLALPNYKL